MVVSAEVVGYSCGGEQKGGNRCREGGTHKLIFVLFFLVCCCK